MAKATLPRNGSSRDELRAHLSKLHVWPVLLAYTHGTIDTAEAHRRLERLGVEVGAEQVGELWALALEEAGRAGRT